MGARLAASLAAALLGIAAVAGCGDDDGGGSNGNGELQEGVVAKVGDAEIEQGDVERQVDALVRAQRRPSAGRTDAKGGQPDSAATQPDAAARRQLRSQALTTLLMREAIEQEAADRGIEVTEEEVEQRWRAVSSDQFKSRKALRRFLGGQTEQDLLDQLRLQTLSERISEQVVERAGGGKKGTRALKRFQERFRKRWTERTICAKGYTVAGCADASSGE